MITEISYFMLGSAIVITRPERPPSYAPLIRRRLWLICVGKLWLLALHMDFGSYWRQKHGGQWSDYVTLSTCRNIWIGNITILGRVA